MNKIVYLLFIIFAMTACSSDDDDPSVPDLDGSWKLVRSCGGFTGECFPADSSNEEIITFSDGADYTATRNGSIVFQTTYEIVGDTNDMFRLNLGNGTTYDCDFDNNNLVFVDNLSMEYEKLDD